MYSDGSKYREKHIHGRRRPGSGFEGNDRGEMNSGKLESMNTAQYEMRESSYERETSKKANVQTEQWLRVLSVIFLMCSQ